MLSTNFHSVHLPDYLLTSAESSALSFPAFSQGKETSQINPKGYKREEKENIVSAKWCPRSNTPIKQHSGERSKVNSTHTGRRIGCCFNRRPKICWISLPPCVTLRRSCEIFNLRQICLPLGGMSSPQNVFFFRSQALYWRGYLYLFRWVEWDLCPMQVEFLQMDSSFF